MDMEPTRSDATTNGHTDDATSYTASSRAKTGQASGPATFVRSVNVATTGGVIRVVIETDGAAQYKDFTLADPSRIVIDLAGLKNASGNKTLSIGAGVIDRVRIGEPSADTVRIVIDVKTMVRYQIVREGLSLVIVIGDAGVAKSN
jgi:hypothetical protein